MEKKCTRQQGIKLAQSGCTKSSLTYRAVSSSMMTGLRTITPTALKICGETTQATYPRARPGANCVWAGGEGVAVLSSPLRSAPTAIQSKIRQQ